MRTDKFHWIQQLGDHECNSSLQQAQCTKEKNWSQCTEPNLLRGFATNERREIGGVAGKKKRHFDLVCYEKKNHYKLMENLKGEGELMMQGERIATVTLVRT